MSFIQKGYFYDRLYHRTPTVFKPGFPKNSGGFSGGRQLTSDDGGLLLREVDILDGLNSSITDPRDPDLITHTQRTLLAQRIFGIALGYEDLNDHHGLRHDPLFQMVTECGVQDDQPLASSPTLCRLENRVDRASLTAMAAVLVDTFIGSFPQPPEELILDVDAASAKTV